jgi:hypothetical protein
MTSAIDSKGAHTVNQLSFAPLDLCSEEEADEA